MLIFVLDDQFLIAFLRKCKYNQERAREKIDAFYTIRGSTPAIFKPRDLTPKLQEILKLRYVHQSLHESSQLPIYVLGNYFGETPLGGELALALVRRKWFVSAIKANLMWKIVCVSAKTKQNFKL